LGTSVRQEDIGEPIPESAEDEADLVLGHHVAVELVGGVVQIVVEFFCRAFSWSGGGDKATTPTLFE
jgi:hypothetical protein